MDKKKLKNLLIGKFTIGRLIRSFVVIYVSVLIFAFVYSDRMIFLPQTSSYEDSQAILKIKTVDGATISAKHFINPNAEFTILYSHGNSEDIADIEPTIMKLYVKGFSVLTYDYRGYGTSKGKASEKKAYRDVEAAYIYLVEEMAVEPKRIISMGRSVGGAVATHLAYKKQVGGLIIESSFVTAFRVITRIPLSVIDKFRNISKVSKVRCPILVIHGMDDRLVPIWHGKKLFEKATNPKFCLWIEGVGHNDDFISAAGDSYWQAVERLAASARIYDKGPEKTYLEE